MISNLARYVCRIALRLDKPPSEVTLHRRATWRFQLVAVELAEALQAQLEERVETAFTNVETSEDKQALVETETGMVTASVGLLTHQSQFDPVASELGRSHHAHACAGGWTHAIHVAVILGRRLFATVLGFLHDNFYVIALKILIISFNK